MKILRCKIMLLFPNLPNGKFLFISIYKKKLQKQQQQQQQQQQQKTRGVIKKRRSENMEQIYRRTPMPKCDLQLY